MTCRLVLFRFQNINKDSRTVSELASAEFRPSFGKTENLQAGSLPWLDDARREFRHRQRSGIAIASRRRLPSTHAAKERNLTEPRCASNPSPSNSTRESATNP